MIETGRIARREDGQDIVEYALLLAVMVVVVGAGAWLIVHTVIAQ